MRWRSALGVQSAALLGVGLELGFQRRKLGERRIRVRRFLTPLEPRWTGRNPVAVALRPLGAMLAAMFFGTMFFATMYFRPMYFRHMPLARMPFSAVSLATLPLTTVAAAVARMPCLFGRLRHGPRRWFGDRHVASPTGAVVAPASSGRGVGTSPLRPPRAPLPAP